MKPIKGILLKGGRVIDPATQLDGERDLLIDGERIVGVETPGAFAGVKDLDVIDVSGKLVVPGLIDLHVHLREPGYEWKETVLTGTDAAAAGGFTTVCCMPNTKPVNDKAEVTRHIIRKAEEAGFARVLPIGAITKGQEGKELSEMVELYEAGCVAFSDDGFPVMNAGVMRRALEYVSMLGAVLTVHEEERTLSDGFAMNEGKTAVKLGLRGFPGAAEEIMISRDIELARLTNSRVHFCHVTTARGVELIRRAKNDGIPVSGECTTHHFTLTEEACEGFNSQAKCSPPLRTDEDREALLRGIMDGTLDAIASDHAPHENDSKECDFPSASNGMLGLQLTVPLALAQVRAGKLSLPRMIEALTVSPAKAFRITPPALKAGAIADIAVINPEERVLLTKSYLRSKSKNTPFLNQELQGICIMSFLGGKRVFDYLSMNSQQSSK